jgi:hypothetical protein
VALSLDASQTFCVEVDSAILDMFVVRARVAGDVSMRFGVVRRESTERIRDCFWVMMEVGGVS